MRKEKRFGRGIILLALLALLLTAGGAYAADVVQIGTAEELAAFRDRVNGGADTLNGQLTADIDLEGAEWVPIGSTWDFHFEGVFDGGGFTISNFKVTGSEEENGLFSLVGVNGAVRNVRVENAVISSTRAFSAGGIAGRNFGTITNCTATGCDVSATGTGGKAGGIAGENYQGTITNCTATGCDVSTTGQYSDAGGIAGKNHQGTITSCMATDCDVSATNGSAGGIAGWSSGTVTNCLIGGKQEGKVSVGVGGNAGGAVGLVLGGTVSGVVVDGVTIGGETDSEIGGAIGAIRFDPEEESTAPIVVENISVNGANLVPGEDNKAGGVVGITEGASGADAQQIIIRSVQTSGVTLSTTENFLTFGGIVGRIDGAYGDEAKATVVQNTSVSTMEVTNVGGGFSIGGLFGQAGGAVEFTNALVQDSTFEDTSENDFDSNYMGGAGGMAEGGEEFVLANIVVMGNNITLSATNSFAGAFAGILGGVTGSNCAAGEGQIKGDKMIGNEDETPGWLTTFAENFDPTTLPMLVALLTKQGDVTTSMTVPKGERVTLSIEALPGTKDVLASMFKWNSSSPDIVAIAATTADGMEIIFEAKEVGESVVVCSVNSNLLKATLTCNVTVVASGDPAPVWGGSNSNCGAAGSVFAVLLAVVPFVRRRR